MTKVTVDIRNNITSLLVDGHSIREVAKRVGVNKSTVQKIRAKYLPGIPKRSSGRHAKLTPQSKRYCVRSITSGKLQTATAVAKKLKEDLNIEVSANTVRRTFKEAGLEAGKKVEKPSLSAKNIRERLKFAKSHKNWTIDDWMRVIWSDETKINRFCSDGMSWCWKSDGNSLQNHHVQQTVKFGGGSIMIWGCMTSKGAGFMCKINDTMTLHVYLEVLQDELQKTIEYYEFNPANIIFQQDNARCHTTRMIQNYFKNQPFDVLEWPAQSPDLNPIETLWAIIKRRLNEYDAPPAGINELWDRIQTIWNDITPETCYKLIASMPKRIEAVLKAKGKWTSY